MRIVVLFLFFSVICLGQSAPALHFEAASIKPAPAGIPMSFSGGPGTSDPGRARFSRVSLEQLISTVYTGNHRERVTGPSSLQSEYTLNLKVPPGATSDQFTKMLGTLLEERFHLKAHRVPKQVRGYE